MKIKEMQNEGIEQLKFNKRLFGAKLKINTKCCIYNKKEFEKSKTLSIC